MPETDGTGVADINGGKYGGDERQGEEPHRSEAAGALLSGVWERAEEWRQRRERVARPCARAGKVSLIPPEVNFSSSIIRFNHYG